MQWIQDPSQNSLDNLNNVGREASRHFRKKEGISERQFEETVTNSKIKNIRDL
jgi:transposase-like protein